MRNYKPKNTKKPKKPDTIYTRLVRAYFYHAFSTLDQGVIQEIIPDDATDPLPADIFLNGSKEGQMLYYNPAPRSLVLVVKLITTVHNRVISDIMNNNTNLINELLTIPESRIQQLAREPEPNGTIDAIIRDQIHASKSTIVAADAHKALMLFVKATVETVLTWVIINKHLPGASINYLPRICQIARMPQSLIQIARNIEMPQKKKVSRDATTSKAKAKHTVATTTSQTSASAPAPAPAPADDEFDIIDDVADEYEEDNASTCIVDDNDSDEEDQIE